MSINDVNSNFQFMTKSRPHVVILGAGASCAAIPHGEKMVKKYLL